MCIISPRLRLTLYQYDTETKILVYFCQYTKNVSEIELLTRDFVSSAARVDSSVNNTCHSFPNKPISAREKLYLPVW